jgi:hypothetical protein
MTAKKKCTAELPKPKPPKSSRLTVLWKVEPKLTRNGRRITQFLCQCSCGENVKVERCKIQNGHKRSCGCLRADTIKEIGNASRARRKERQEASNG